MPTFQAGSFTFASKAECRRRLSEMLKVWNGKPRVEGEDRELLEALIERHPEAARKKGSGIQSFFVAGAWPKGVCFWLRRNDGTTDNFSFVQCLDGSPTLRTKLRMACRNAIQDSMQAFKQAAFTTGTAKCEATGKELVWANAHVDHIEPFYLIADSWIEGTGVTEADLSKDSDGGFGESFTDQRLVASFRAYHDERAKLRVVSVFVNLSKGSKKEEA